MDSRGKPGEGGDSCEDQRLSGPIAGSAWAQESNSQTLQLTPSRDSGVSGTATLTESGGQVEVRLEMQGLPEDGVSRLAHIRKGATCADDRAGNGGPVELPLEDVTAQGGTGSSTSTAGTTLQELSREPHYVNVHAEKTGDEAPPGVSCADIVVTGMQQPMMGSTEPLPKSGSLAPSAFLPAAALILGSARQRAA